MTTPAVVSGPGALSRRTDSGQPIRHMADPRYGEDRDFVAQQKAAPLAEGGDRAAPPRGGIAPTMSPGPPTGAVTPPPQLTPLSAPTTRPGEPVTAGAELGPGPGAPPRRAPEPKPQQLSQALAPYAAGDDTGLLQEFMWNLAEMGL